MQAGDTVYLSDGQEAVYIGAVGEEHAVRPILYDEDAEEDLEGEPRIVKAVYAKPPREKLDAEIAKLRSEESALRTELHKLRQLVTDANRDKAELMKRVTQHKALERIDDYLAGKITHYVMHRQDQVRIMAADSPEAMCPGANNRVPRLLMLGGASKGDVTWRLSRYSDDSGRSWEEVTPCCSAADALVAAQAQYEKRMREEKTAWMRASLTESALKLGLRVQPDEVEALIAYETAKARDAATKAQVQFGKMMEEEAKVETWAAELRKKVAAQ